MTTSLPRINDDTIEEIYKQDGKVVRVALAILSEDGKSMRTHSHWSDVAFAVLWIGALSVCWIYVKMSVRFQSLLGLGIGLNFPVSPIYVSVIYIASVSLILWVGLGIYLAITGGLKPRRLLRGLSVILLVVAPTQVAGIFLKGLRLPRADRFE